MTSSNGVVESSGSVVGSAGSVVGSWVVGSMVDQVVVEAIVVVVDVAVVIGTAPKQLSGTSAQAIGLPSIPCTTSVLPDALVASAGNLIVPMVRHFIGKYDWRTPG